MSLIATARALDDQRFLWRVRAAMLDVAKSVVSKTDSTPEELAFAYIVIDAPMTQFKSMEALVANNTKVSESISVDQFNTVATETVLDADIISAVRNAWPIVAARYAANSVQVVSE